MRKYVHLAGVALVAGALVAGFAGTGRDTFTVSCVDGFTQDADGSCVPVSWGEPVAPILEWPTSEESPDWDCRVMGNLQCGVLI